MVAYLFFLRRACSQSAWLMDMRSTWMVDGSSHTLELVFVFLSFGGGQPKLQTLAQIGSSGAE
jgi:hypothetical protein